MDKLNEIPDAPRELFVTVTHRDAAGGRRVFYYRVPSDARFLDVERYARERAGGLRVKSLTTQEREEVGLLDWTAARRLFAREER